MSSSHSGTPHRAPASCLLDDSDVLLLTIAIPTWNRSEKLDEQLSRLSCVSPGPWEILVADNGSVDETRACLRAWESRLDGTVRFRWHSHDHNIGFDANVLWLYEQSRGKFVWMLSDDDEFDPKLVTPDLTEVLRSDLGLVILNQEKNGEPVIRDGDHIDLVPYSPVGMALTKRVGFPVQLAPGDEAERISLVLLGSQLSVSVFRGGLRIPAGVRTGGLPQCLLSNVSLMSHPSYMITSDAVVRCGEKTWISRWFLDSCLFGAQGLYTRPAMGLNPALSRRIGSATARNGLQCLALGAANRASVESHQSPFALGLALARTHRVQAAKLLPWWLTYALLWTLPSSFGLVARAREITRRVK